MLYISEIMSIPSHIIYYIVLMTSLLKRSMECINQIIEDLLFLLAKLVTRLTS